MATASLEWIEEPAPQPVVPKRDDKTTLRLPHGGSIVVYRYGSAPWACLHVNTPDIKCESRDEEHRAALVMIRDVTAQALADVEALIESQR